MSNLFRGAAQPLDCDARFFAFSPNSTSRRRILRDLEARHLIERRVAKADLRRGVVSISAKGLKLIEAVAPSSEAIYAAITKRYGARKLAELQDMLHALEGSLSQLRVSGDAELGNE